MTTGAKFIAVSEGHGGARAGVETRRLVSAREEATRLIAAITNPHFLEHRDRPVVQLLEHFLFANVLAAGCMPVPWQETRDYVAPEHFVLAHGQFMPWAGVPKGRLGIPHQCFGNTLGRMLRYGKLYAEGYVNVGGVIPVLHAWNVPKTGKLVVQDYTLGEPEVAIHAEAERGYFGVVFKSEYVMEAHAHPRCGASMLDNYDLGWPLLQKGASPASALFHPM